MAVALSSLRVGADFDASGYVRGAQQKVDADQRMIAADKARNASLAQADAALGKAIPGVAALSRSLLDGYGAGQTFEAQIRKIGNAVDRGLGLDRAGVLLDAVYRKFGLTADSAALAQKGFVSIVPAVDQLNSRLAAEAAFSDDLTAAVQRLNAAQRVQETINANVGIIANDNSAGRAADIAALGQSLDTLRARYSPLFAAQQQYLAALRDLNTLEARTALTERERAEAIARTKATFASQVTTIKGAADATGLAGYQMQNLGYQLNDVATMLASGASPFQVLATQGGQVYQVLSSANGGVGGALKSIGSSVAAMITPTRVAVASVAALGVAGVAVYQSWKKTELEFDAVSRQAGVTLTALHALDQAAAIKGIDTTDLLAGARSFSATLYQARMNVGGLSDVLLSNGVKAKGFEETLKSVADIIQRLPNDQARLNVLQQAGLPATDQWLQLMKQGRAGIQGAIDDAVLLGNATDQHMIAKARAFDEAWAKSWKQFKSEFSAGFVELYGLFDGLYDKALNFGRKAALAAGVDAKGNLLRSGTAAGNQLTNAQAASFYDAVGLKDPAKGAANDPAALTAALARQQARMSALGQSAGTLDVVRQKYLDLQRAQIAGAGLTSTQIKNQIDLAREQALGTYQIKSQVDQTKIQADTIGMAVGAAAEYTARMNLLTEAVRNHKNLTAQDRAEIDAQAKALGEAAQAAATRQIRSDIAFGQRTSLLSPEDVQIAQQLKGIYPDVATALASVEASGLRTNQALSGLSSSISSSMVSGLTDMTTGAKSVKDGFSDMATSIIREIEKMIIQLTIVGPLMRSLQGAFGGGGNIISNLFSGAGSAASQLAAGVIPVAKGNAFGESNVIPFARGGAFSNLVVNTPTFFRFANGGAMQNGVMGEAGPEAVMPLRRGPDGRLGVAAHTAGTGSGSMGAIVNVYNAPAGSTAQSRVSRGSNGEMQVDVMLKNAVRGVISDDLATGTGVAPTLKKFASLALQS
ncbi:MAG: phage tail length tape measure family protein [Xanthobacteraceae bacterium]